MGPWFEWTMIKFVTDEQIISDSDRVDNGQLPLYFQDDEYPSKPLCFFHADDDPEVYAIVQSCEKRNQELDSILTQRWRKEWHQISVLHYQPVLQAVSVDSFGQHILMVEDDPILQESMHCDELLEGCTLILPREDFWPNQFQLIFE